MNRMLTIAVLTMCCVTSSASAGDAWWKVCRPMADYTHPRIDPCAHQKFKRAAREVCRAPKPCIEKRCSLREACRDYRSAFKRVLCAPKVCYKPKVNCHDALDAYKRADEELRKCHKCETR